VLRQYAVVMLIGGDGNAPLELLPGGMTALQMYLLGGGRLLASSHRWNHGPPSLQQIGVQQGSGIAYFLSRYFAGFERSGDDLPATSLRGTGPAGETLFPQPIDLADAPTDTAAGNGGRLDVGRPLAALHTVASDAMQPPMDIGLAAPLVVEKTMPYMRPLLRAEVGAAAMTMVTADATLEVPERADFIPWRAAFAGFAFEAIASDPGNLDRADVLSRLHAWAVEPADGRLSLDGREVLDADAPETFAATWSSDQGVRAVAWRWDTGDGRTFVSTVRPETTLTWDGPGIYTVRVEATTSAGHTYVAAKRVRVGGLYLPAVARTPRL
jgi:hypothetical protein